MDCDIADRMYPGLATVGAGKTCAPRGRRKGVAGQGVIDPFIVSQNGAEGLAYHSYIDVETGLRQVRSVESSRTQATFHSSLNRLFCKANLFGIGTQIPYEDPHRAAIGK